MKKIKYLLIVFFASFIFILTANAGSASISISGPSTAKIGQTVKFSVTVRANSSLLGICSFDVALDNFNSSGTSVQLDDKCYGRSSYTYSFSYKVKSSGNATITVKNSNITMDDESIAYPSASKTIRVLSQEEILASYSDNNNLKDITIDGATLSPAFDKNVLNYTAVLDAGTEKINVNAVKEDSTATVTGAGEIEVSEGENKITITVTSQRGNAKVYTVIVTVIDENPIKVSLDGKSYNVVKKASLLQDMDGFTKTTVKIGKQDIPALYNEKAKIYVVGLKDQDGNIAYYIYNPKTKKYTAFNQIKSNYITILSVDSKKAPKGYIITKININGKDVTAYKLNSSSKFALVYGINLETGKKGYYVYDIEEKTLQRYDDSIYNKLNKENRDLKIVCLALIAGVLILFVFVIILALKKPKNKGKSSSLKEDKKDKKTKEEKIEKKEIKKKAKNEKTMEIDSKKIKEMAKKKKEKRKSIDELLDEM